MPQYPDRVSLGGCVAEDTEGQGTSAEASGAGVDPAALALGLAGADRSKANAYLDDQRAFIAKQSHHLDELLKQLPLALWEKRIGMALRIATLFVGLGFAAVLALMVWNAAHADGVVIESFSVPPDLAARGLTGDVVAAHLMDKINIALTNQTGAFASRSAANGLNDDIKVEIPETGISAGEAYRFLRRWLGHETSVEGEIIRLPDNRLSLTVRVDGRDGADFSGGEDQVNDLVLKAADRVAAVTSPAIYAGNIDSPASGAPNEAQLNESQSLLEGAVADLSQPPLTRALAMNNLALYHSIYQADIDRQETLWRQAMALAPDYPVAFGNFVTFEAVRGHYEDVFKLAPTALAVNQRAKGYNMAAITGQRTTTSMNYAQVRGDYGEVADLAQRRLDDRLDNATRLIALRRRLAVATAYRHDGAAKTILSQGPAPILPSDAYSAQLTQSEVNAAFQDWPTVIAQTEALQASIGQSRGINSYWHIPTEVKARLALAKAGMGDFAAAEATIADTPGDDYPVLVIRGRIAAMAGEAARADEWFARALAAGPSIPFAETSWGQALLARGKPDDAIAKFTLANQKGPHFADPLEGWGEALMKKNQSHLALAKFAEAEKYAPNWGRLHLKWGEALAYAGKKDEAQKEFAGAATLDLTADEKAELARHP